MKNRKENCARSLGWPLAWLAAGAVWLALFACGPAPDYSRGIIDAEGDFEIQITHTGNCLPDVIVDRPVNRISIYKLNPEATLAARAGCAEGLDILVGFTYEDGTILSSERCEAVMLEGVELPDDPPDTDSDAEGGAEDAGPDAGADAGEDGGVGPNATCTIPCQCVLEEDWGSSDQPACVGRFRVVAATSDGLVAKLEYEQSIDEPPEQYDTDPAGGSSIGFDCGCSAVGAR